MWVGSWLRKQTENERDQDGDIFTKSDFHQQVDTIDPVLSMTLDEIEVDGVYKLVRGIFGMTGVWYAIWIGCHPT